MWLLSHNKLMTKDNLLKRNNVKPLYCALCEEHESINHMFFDCVVAKVNLNELSEYCKVHIGCNYESVAKFWISSKKKNAVLNSVVVATLWSLWNCRNDIVFQRKDRCGVK